MKKRSKIFLWLAALLFVLSGAVMAFDRGREPAPEVLDVRLEEIQEMEPEKGESSESELVESELVKSELVKSESVEIVSAEREPLETEPQTKNQNTETEEKPTEENAVEENTAEENSAEVSISLKDESTPSESAIKSAAESVIEPVIESAAESVMESAHTCSLTVVETAATCLEEGMVQEICLECKQVAGNWTIPALGHDFKRSIWESPTCLKGGYYNNTCERCGLVECITEAVLPHEPEEVLVQEGNCMEDTIIRHICRQCGQQTEGDTRYTPSVHEWTKGVVDGTEITYCTMCGVTQ